MRLWWTDVSIYICEYIYIIYIRIYIFICIYLCTRWEERHTVINIFVCTNGRIIFPASQSISVENEKTSIDEFKPFICCEISRSIQMSKPRLEELDAFHNSIGSNYKHYDNKLIIHVLLWSDVLGIRNYLNSNSTKPTRNKYFLRHISISTGKLF